MRAVIAVASPLLTEISAVLLTPAQRAAIWEIAAILDERHIPAPTDPTTGDAVWIEVPTARLRGAWGRSDNVWLRELLRRLEGVRFGGKAGTDAWGGVLLAQWKITGGGSLVRLLIPPAGLAALRTPETFARIDTEAAHRLPPHARTLYGLLADRQRQKVRRWVVELAELKALLGVAGRYEGRFNDFRRWVLEPATTAINDFGVIRVAYEVKRLGRRVDSVVFTWDLKDPADATATATENDRHSAAQRQIQESAKGRPLRTTVEEDTPHSTALNTDAPPLIVQDRALRYLDSADSTERLKWAKRAVELGAIEIPAMSTRENISKWVRFVAKEMADGNVFGRG